ncbi:MAG: hypothetical protein RJB58_190 [Pseudomonadota bacterium]
MTTKRWIAAVLLALVAALLLLWLARAQIAARFAQNYFRSHGIESSVEIGTLGLSGGSGRFALGPRANPTVAADSIELFFDPLSWIPRVVEVRLVNPVVRARLDESGKVRLEALQDWIDSLQQQQGKSRFVSDDLAVALTGWRVLLTTPSGALDIGGDVKLVRNLPVSASLRARPATITHHGAVVSLRAASLDFDNSGKLALRLSASATRGDLAVRDMVASLDATGFKWVSGETLTVSAPSARLQASAASLSAGQAFTAPKLDVLAGDLSAVVGREISAGADLTVSASADADSPVNKKLAAMDPVLARAVAANLSRLTLAFSARAEQRGAQTSFALTAPLTGRGASGGALTVPVLKMSGVPGNMNGALQASLSGNGLPDVKLTLGNLVLDGTGLRGDAAISARFNYAMMRGASINANGVLSLSGARYTFQSASCARATLAAFRPGASDMAKDARGNICGARLEGEGAAWKFTGQARGVGSQLTLGNAQLEQGTGTLSFEGVGGDFHGTVQVTAGQVSDRLKPIRFKPMLGSGNVALQGGVWRGRFAMTDMDREKLGDVDFSHTMARGTGSAHIAAPALTFTPDKLQPENISPMLAAFRRASGTASFTGDITWTRSEIKSSGNLGIEKLDFLTPLGQAHTVKTNIAFVSLLPPVTAENQEVTISRIDWTLPFSGVDLRFAFNPTSVKVNALSSGWAEGKISLGAFVINIANLKQVSGTASLDSIALGSLVTASNLGERVKLEGKISGTIPFEVTPEGFRITKGRIASDGPGRLSINRSLWNQGGTVSVNAVQDFAYQALEHLAYDEMTAELNSIANGRLSILFKIKGRSDPPKRQVAEIAITDIIDGTALQKTVPLPSGTPIDLTLDTSLNFDELLKSYAEAWSKTLSPEGQPDVSRVEQKP